MSRIVALALIACLILGCDSKLSDEQRKALREEMEDREIKKIGPDQIYKKATEEGQKIAGSLSLSTNLDSIRAACKCDVIFAVSDSTLSEKEKAVFEAYEFNPTADGNLQKDSEDLLTFARPESSGDSLLGVWFIRFKKAEIIKSL